MLRRLGPLLSAPALTCLLLAGCAAGPGAAPAVPVGTAAGPAAPSASSAASEQPVPDARVGTPAASQRITFVPERIVLPGGADAEVRPAATVDGVLQVPEEVRHVGWWDGSSRVGDPFGHTVLAGHVDSATEGLGFFARLSSLERGDVVTVSGDGHRQRFRVSSVRAVAKDALATRSPAFDLDGPPRLVLITCTGAYLRDRGGYQENLVVTAVPMVS